MDKNGARPPSHKKGSGAEGIVSGLQDLPDDVLVMVLRRVSKEQQGLGGPLRFALVCRRFAALRFRAAVPSVRFWARVPGPRLAHQLQVYRGPTSLKLNGHSLLGFRALWRALAVQGPLLRALEVYDPVNTCLECEGECPESHDSRDSQLCAQHGQASAWWAFSGPFLRAHPGLRTLKIQGSTHKLNQETCSTCCLGFTGSDSFVSVHELRSSLPRLKHLGLSNVNLGWPQDWPLALPSLKSLTLVHKEHDDITCVFPWSVLELTGLTSLTLQLDLLSVFDQDFGRLTKLRKLSLSLVPPMAEPEGIVLPPSIWTLTRLKSLCLIDMGSIPERGLGRLVGLTELLLVGCDLPSLPYSLRALEFVAVDSVTGLEGLQERLGRCETLRMLLLKDCTWSEMLPTDFGRLTSLRYLYMSDLDSLEVLPEDFGRLQSLQDLTVMNCDNLQRLPADFGLLESLTSLKLKDLSSLEEMSDGFGRLQSLRTLEITGCQILRRLPADFGQLSSLTDVKLAHLEVLEELPEMTRSLGHLRKLDLESLTGLHRSRLPGLVVDNMQEDMSLPTEVPPGLGGCACLEMLFIKNCGSLVILPEHLLRLSSLQGLILIDATRPGEIDKGFLKGVECVYIKGASGTVMQKGATKMIHEL